MWGHYTATLERDGTERSSMPGEAEIEAARAEAFARIEKEDISWLDKLAILNAGIDLMVAQRAGEVSTQNRQVKLADLRKHLAKGETALIAHEVDAWPTLQRTSREPALGRALDAVDERASPAGSARHQQISGAGVCSEVGPENVPSSRSSSR